MPHKDPAARRAWIEKNRERIRANDRARYARHREKRKALVMKRYFAKRELIDAQHAAWRRANPQRVRSYARRWTKANPDRTRAYYQKYRLANLSKVAAAMRAYRKRKPEIMAAVDARHRVKRLGATGTHTSAQWLEKRALLGNVCFYCGEAKTLERDHKRPICRGGTDDITNIVPCCARCNGRKWTRTAQEFLALGRPA